MARVFALLRNVYSRRKNYREERIKSLALKSHSSEQNEDEEKAAKSATIKQSSPSAVQCRKTTTRKRNEKKNVTNLDTLVCQLSISSTRSASLSSSLSLHIVILLPSSSRDKPTQREATNLLRSPFTSPTLEERHRRCS
jgi:hypothetical protein